MFFDTFISCEQINPTLEVSHMDKQTLERQRELVFFPEKNLPRSYVPFEAFDEVKKGDFYVQGAHLIKEGKLGCLLLAGGQGTRLQFNGPKGCYPISVVHGKSLFQLCAEKVLAASHWAGRPLLLAIMTSPENDAQTKEFFQKHAFFGLDSSQIYFFSQTELPFLDERGEVLFEEKGKIVVGPDGNGSSLKQFVASGIYKEWQRKGIEFLNVILVDNPLADPFDAELVGYHSYHNLDVTLKCTEKKDPAERVGVVVSKGGKAAVVEYSELSEEQKQERREDGKLAYACANLSLFCFSMDFILKISDQEIPLHKAWKKTHAIDGTGILKETMAWKFETFIFDWLDYTRRARVLLYPRNECFAPLKNFSGEDSPETVRRALQEREQKLFEKIHGQPAPAAPFEVPADFYYL